MMFLTWVLAGVSAGLLAGWALKRGGFGLRWDIALGLVGSIGGSWLLHSLGFYPSAGVVATAVVAFILAVIPIGAQRKFWV
ncbi:MAG TPA: GlsB/YeaQ/YmgE family stress response membrane protein, partial [Actinomycetota bacterium]|nr:GlsB/YeaQ/YmgE family stress response membrane protein [Actinomycetota bacterium]